MSQPAASSPLDLSSLLLSLSLPTTPRRSPELIVMDRLNVRLIETHQEVTLSRDAPHADSAVLVYPDRVAADASPVEIRIAEEGRSGISHLPVISIDEGEEEEDPVLREVFSIPHSTRSHEEKCNCGACQISSGTLPESTMEQGASRVPRPLTIADMDVREMEENRRDFLSPSDAPSEPTTPNANRSRRPSEKLDYGIDWIEAFKMAPPRQRNCTLADEIDGRLSAMEQEEKQRELMTETLNKIDQVSKGTKTEEKRSEMLIDSSITLKDIFGQSAKSDDVVFNTSISLDDVFAGMKSSPSHQKISPTADRYYYHDDEDDEEVLPPEVAALYSSHPSTLPQSSSVNIDDVFAALDRKNRISAPRQNLDDFYADPPSEVFSDSAVSSRQLTESKATDRERGEEEEEGNETRSSSSGVSHGEETPREEENWLMSLVEKKRSVEMNPPRRGNQMDDSENEPSPPFDPAQFYPVESNKQTRKESYLQECELFSGHSSSPREKSIEEEKERIDLEWLNRLADSSTEEILDAVFSCSAVGGEKGKKCNCQACDPAKSIYLEREAATASEERKRSLHLVNPVEITLEEVFEGKKREEREEKSRRDGGEKKTGVELPPIEIDLEEVFSTPVHSPSSRGIDSEKWKPRTIAKEVKQSVVPQTRKRSADHEKPLAPSDIDLREVFEGKIHPSSSTTNVDLDLVFVPSSSSSTTTSRVNLDKFQPRSLEREQKSSIPSTPSRPLEKTDQMDMEAVFTPSKTTKEESAMISSSTFPVLLREETKKEEEVPMSSIPVIIAEGIVSEAMDEALRSPKLEKIEGYGMISSSSFPVFVVDKKAETLSPETVKFGLSSRSASPEPTSVDLDQVFSGVSTEHKPRIDLSKYEQRTLERKKQHSPRPVIISNSSVPVIVADPLDMDLVFSPSTTRVNEDLPTTPITSVPVIIAEEIVSGSMSEAMKNTKEEKSEEHGMISHSTFPVFIVDKEDSTPPHPEDVQFDVTSPSSSSDPSIIDFDQVFNGVSTVHKPRIDLSKYEERRLERRKEPTHKPVMHFNSSVPVIVADPLDMDQVFNPTTSQIDEDQPPSISISSVSVIIAEEIVSEAMDEALRSPKLEKIEDHGMISSSSFPVFVVDKKAEILSTDAVKLGLSSRSASPEPTSVDLDQVFRGVSTEHKPRIDLAKYEQRTLERKKQPSPRPVIFSNSSVPVIVADPLDMDQVFNPLSKKESIQSLVAETISQDALKETLQSEKLEKSEIDLDQVFSSSSQSSAPRVDLSKFEIRSLERRRDTPRPVMATPSTRSTVVADPLDMNLVFSPRKNELIEEEETPLLPSDSIPIDIVSSSIAEVIVAEAMEESLHLPSPSSSSSFAIPIPQAERTGSFSAIDSASSLDTPSEHVVYPRTITHIRSSAPDFVHLPNEIIEDAVMKTVEEEEEEEEEETPLPVFSGSRNPAYGMASDRPWLTQSEDAPGHISDPISLVTDLSPSPSVKKIIAPSPSNERITQSLINLDDVFVSSLSPSSSSTTRVELDKFVARTLERQQSRPRSSAPPPVTRETTPRDSSIPPSSISVDDIFTPQPSISAAPSNHPRESIQSESSSDPMDDPAAEVDLDSVFAASFGSEGKGQSRMTPSVDRILTAEFNERKEAAVSTLSTLPSSELGDLTPAPHPPPRRSPRPSASEAPSDETPTRPPRQKLVSSSSFPILISNSPSVDDVPTPPRNREGRPSPIPPGIVLIDDHPHPVSPPPSLVTTPTPPSGSHRRTDSLSLPRSRDASYSKVSESITEDEGKSSLTVDAIFSAASSDAARPSVTMIDRGEETTVDIVLPPRSPPRMNFPPPPPVEEIEYDGGKEITSRTVEEDVKEARLMASPDFSPLSVVTAPVEIEMDEVFERKILTPSRFDTDRWQPRTLEREKKRMVEEVIEKREKSDLPQSNVDINEIFSGRLTTTEVEYVSSPPRLTLKNTEEKEKWEEDLSKEIDEYEKRRNRLGQETDGSVRSTISRASSIPFSSTPDGMWRRNESVDPIIALLEKEKKRKESSSSEKSTERKGSRGSWKVEHLLEPQSDGLIEISEHRENGAHAEMREAKRNGKVWRVDRVQKTASSIEDSEDEKGVRIHVHSIPAPLSVSMDSIDDIEKSIDDAFEEALSPRGRNIEIRRIPSSSIVQAEVHRQDESETYPHPEYSSETIEGKEGVYRSVTSLPSTSDTTKVIFPLTSQVEEQRFVTSASIRLEKSLPTPDTTMEKNNGTRREYQSSVDPSLHWIPTSIPVEKVTMRKRSRSEGPLGLLEDVVMREGEDSSDTRNYRMSWHPSSIRNDLEDRGYRGLDERIHGSLTTTVRVAGYSSPKSGRSREARERRKKIIRKSRHSVSSSTSNGESTSTKPDEEEMLEVEVRKRHIILRGSYDLVVSKDEPLGLLLLSLSDGQPIVPAALDFSVLPKLRRLLRECMTRRTRSVSMLSSRGASILDVSDPANDNVKTVSSDLFHPINNPRGKVNLCTAENRVCEKEMSRKLEEIRFHPDSHRWMLRYSGSGGINETKLSLVAHFSSLLSVSIDAEEALLLPSCTAAYDVLSHLCCDSHDVILTPSPYYARIKNNCSERNECRVEAVPLDMTKPELFVSDFEREFATWMSKGEKVRAIVLVNPHNPMGNIFSRYEMMSVCEWAMSNDLFIIVDEILAGTIYEGKDILEFPSILSLKNELSKPDQLVWMGSLSKDLGVPGIKTALIVSSSSAIREAVRRMENLGSVPAPSQLIINQLINDKQWLSSTLISVRRRLHSHARFVVDSLSDIGVSSILPKGGICLMADFSKFLPSISSEEENSLHRRFIERGVVLTKGESTVAPTPGWFRIAFGVPKEELELGIRRIYSTIAREATVKRRVDYGGESNGKKTEWIVSEVRSTRPGTTGESA